MSKIDYKLSSMLGHTDLATTEVYAKLNIELLRDTLEEILNCPLTNSLIGKKITLLWVLVKKEMHINGFWPVQMIF